MNDAGPPGTTDPAAERRQVTVLFCDLVGSTALSQGRSDEDVFDILLEYQRCVTGIVAQLGGYVARYMGDGVLAYFGYPTAHEDDAERAVRVGLRLADAVPRSAPAGLALQVRIGIATGTVVVGELIGHGMAEERAIVGDAPNLAARLQALAEPNTVVIAERTRRLVGGLFDARLIGPVALKGFAEPQPAWEVGQASPMTSRFDALRAPSLTPLVGRDGPAALLHRLWAQARQGQGQVALLSGEAGIGKSRLIAAMQEEWPQADAPYAILRFNSLPYFQDSVLHPFIDQLDRSIGAGSVAEPGAGRLPRLRAALAPAGLPDDSATLLAGLLGIPVQDGHRAPDLGPARRRERIVEALVRHVCSAARRQPTVLVFEDAHWFDGVSVDVLSQVVGAVAALPILALVTARPGFDPAWIEQAHVTPVPLGPLSTPDAATIIAWLAGPLAEEIVTHVASRTDGVPLFIEELTKALVEARTSGRPADALPLTLHASLTARLDRLGPVARGVAQAGAVIGRDFSATLLAEVAQADPAAFQAALADLTGAGLMVLGDDAAYAFKHALVRDAAYAALLRRPRRDLHLRAVQAIERLEPATLDKEPGAMAHHCAEAGLFEKAVEFRLKAGLLAFDRSAFPESIEQLQSGLALIPQLPGPRATLPALRLRNALGHVLSVSRGYSDPATGEAYAQARLLCAGLGSIQEVIYTLLGEFGNKFISGNLSGAASVTGELSHHADATGNELIRWMSFGCKGIIMAQAGKLEDASDALSAARHGSKKLQSLPLKSNADARSITELGSYVRGYQAWVMVARGFVDQGERHAAELVAEAPLTLRNVKSACAGCYSVWTAQLCRNAAAAEGTIDALVSLCDAQGFAFWQAVSWCAKGWVLASTGHVADGIGVLERGLRLYRAIGSQFLRPMGENALAELLVQDGQHERAIDILDGLLHLVAANGDRWLEAETLRIKGEALLALGQPERAVACFAAAVEIARHQGALLWELRASLALAQHWRGLGRADDARGALLPVCRRFQEGFSATDLRAAKAVLGALSGGAQAGQHLG